MPFDPETLLALNVINLLALAIALPVIMGRRLSIAASAARMSLIVHAGAWIAVILSEQWSTWWWANFVLSTLSMVCFSASNWLLYQALASWLGPRRLKRSLLLLAVAMPLGYAVAFQSYEWRVGWANLLIALQLAVLATATLKSETRLVGRWRLALFGCLASMSILTLARGVLGAFFTELYPNFAAPNPVNLTSLLVANLSMVLTNMSILVAWREEAELQLRDQAEIDPLTGVLNRRGWDEHATRAFLASIRHQQALALLSLDLDHFKALNDTRGHEAGDAALRLFGEILRHNRRAGDLVARTGGEEFCVLCPMTDAAAAKAFEARFRARLRAESSAVLGYPLSYSAGLACRTMTDFDLEGLRSRSDKALYLAKSEGRGRLMEIPSAHSTRPTPQGAPTP